MKVISVLQNERAVRVSFRVDGNHFMVVKLFAENATWTVKLWKGDYQRTAKFWNTKQAVQRPASDVLVRDALEVIRQAKAVWSVVNENAVTREA